MRVSGNWEAAKELAKSIHYQAIFINFTHIYIIEHELNMHLEKLWSWWQYFSVSIVSPCNSLSTSSSLFCPGSACRAVTF